MKILDYIKRIGSVKTELVYKIPKNAIKPPISERLVFKEINASNLQSLERLRNKEVINRFEEFIARGERGFFVLYNGEVVAHGWLIFNPSQPRKVCDYFNLPAASGFIHYCYVDTRFRGKGIYKYLLSEMSNYYYENSEGTLYIDTNINNLPAQRAILSTGGIFIFKLTIWRFLGKNVLIIKR